MDVELWKFDAELVRREEDLLKDVDGLKIFIENIDFSPFPDVALRGDISTGGNDDSSIEKEGREMHEVVEARLYDLYFRAKLVNELGVLLQAHILNLDFSIYNIYICAG